MLLWWDLYHTCVCKTSRWVQYMCIALEKYLNIVCLSSKQCYFIHDALGSYIGDISNWVILHKNMKTHWSIVILAFLPMLFILLDPCTPHCQTYSNNRFCLTVALHFPIYGTTILWPKEVLPVLPPKLGSQRPGVERRRKCAPCRYATWSQFFLRN